MTSYDYWQRLHKAQLYTRCTQWTRQQQQQQFPANSMFRDFFFDILHILKCKKGEKNSQFIGFICSFSSQVLSKYYTTLHPFLFLFRRDSGQPMLALHFGCFTAKLTNLLKVLSNWKLVELKMLNFSDHARTGISILTSATTDIVTALCWKILVYLCRLSIQNWPGPPSSTWPNIVQLQASKIRKLANFV